MVLKLSMSWSLSQVYELVSLFQVLSLELVFMSSRNTGVMQTV